MALEDVFLWDYFRWVNVILSMAVVSLLIAGTWHRWASMPARYKRMAPWLIGTYVVIAYGSGEAVALDVQPGVRVVLLTCNLMGLVVAILYRITDDDLTEKDIYIPFYTRWKQRQDARPQ